MIRILFKISACVLIASTVLYGSNINRKNAHAVGGESVNQNTQTNNGEDNGKIQENYLRTLETSTEGNNLDDFYISESNYENDMNNIVMPYIESRLESGYIEGIDDAKLYYEKYKADNPKGNIVISHGYTESLEKYHEIIYYFLNSGYNVFGIEHRGHGRSGSLGIADKSQIYVNSFDDYIEDFKTFMDEVVVTNNEDKEMYLFAHSMGGGIGSSFLEIYPQYFSKAVLNAPMMEVDTGNIPDFIAKIVVKTAVTFGQDGKYVIGKEPFAPAYNFEPIGTTSENRWSYVNNIINNNEELQRGGASYKWTDESFKVTKELTKKENASKVEIPVLLFQSGDDAYVKPGGQNKFAEYAKNCDLRRIENGKHEIFFESDEIQKPYLNEVLEFYMK